MPQYYSVFFNFIPVWEFHNWASAINGVDVVNSLNHLRAISSIWPVIIFLNGQYLGGGGGGERRHESLSNHNFVVIGRMIIKFGTDIKTDVFYTMVTKSFVTSLLLRNYDVLTCILVDISRRQQPDLL